MTEFTFPPARTPFFALPLPVCVLNFPISGVVSHFAYTIHSNINKNHIAIVSRVWLCAPASLRRSLSLTLSLSLPNSKSQCHDTSFRSWNNYVGIVSDVFLLPFITISSIPKRWLLFTRTFKMYHSNVMILFSPIRQNVCYLFEKWFGQSHVHQRWQLSVCTWSGWRVNEQTGGGVAPITWLGAKATRLTCTARCLSSISSQYNLAVNAISSRGEAEATPNIAASISRIWKTFHYQTLNVRISPQ